MLSAWEKEKKIYFEEKETEENVLAEKGDVTEDIGSPSVNEGVTPETTGEITVEEPVDYTELTFEDFFPLKLLIPKIEVEAIVEEGTDKESLKNGPGYEALTPLPGEQGRCTISGHRTTYGATFNRLDELENGDLIYLETINNGLFTYAVTGMEIVRATDVWILEGSNKKELVLTTCHPKYSAARRLVIISELVNIYPFGFQ